MLYLKLQTSGSHLFQDRLKSFLQRVNSQASSLDKALTIELDDSSRSTSKDATSTSIDCVYLLDALSSDAFERAFTDNKRALQRAAKGLPPTPYRIQWPAFPSDASQV